MTSGVAILSATASLGDFRTEVLRSGDGAAGTVLALHSLGLDAHAFDALRQALGERWRIVSFDQRGHGASAGASSASLDQYVQDAIAALASCGAAPVHVLGHSMGGAVAALLAASVERSAPGRIASLTLVSTPAHGGAVFTQRGAEVRAGGVAAASAQTLTRWFGEAHGLDHAPQAYARAALARMQPAGLASAWEALSQFPGYAGLVQDLPPTLCIAAADDLSTPPKAMQPIVDAFAAAGRDDQVEFFTLDSGGHMAPLFAAPPLVAALTAHWRPHAKAIDDLHH